MLLCARCQPKVPELVTWELELGIDPLSEVTGASQVALMVKNSPANAEDVRDRGLIPGSGRSSREGNGYPLQYSCLENHMDRGAWRALVHRVAKSQTRLKRPGTHTQEAPGHSFT